MKCPFCHKQLNQSTEDSGRVFNPSCYRCRLFWRISKRTGGVLSLSLGYFGNYVPSGSLLVKDEI